MRLLNTGTYILSEFQSNIPSYAILSHVWRNEEITFQDINDHGKAMLKKGWEKIVGACNTAKRDKFEYIWIDTCCINKESSAELSEAINSMYAWYRNAQICYAYLWDVPSDGNYESLHSPFSLSAWFTRGWTLQELIAPPRVNFYGSDWTDIGTKATLQRTISAITGIDTRIIVGKSELENVPIAVKMSWAAKRNTTREEDVAYSLMGLFDINMPLLYGEGKKAFIRLQHEIIKKSNDHSIFAWTTEPRPSQSSTSHSTPPISDEYRGILARSPNDFQYSHNVERIPQVSLDGAQPKNPATSAPYSITNQGIQIKLPINTDVPPGTFMKHRLSACLNCRFSGESAKSICIVLGWSHDLQRYVRAEAIPWPDHNIARPVRMSSLYIADIYGTASQSHRTGLDIKTDIPRDYGTPRVISHLNLSGTIHGQKIQFSTNNLGAAEYIIFNEPRKQERFAVLFGIWKPGVVWCDILLNIDSARQSHEEIRAACESAAAVKSFSKNKFLDRTSAELSDGWSVMFSLTPETPSQFTSSKFCGTVEFKRGLKKQQLSAPLPVRPQKMEACLIVPLLRQHGFTVDINNLQHNSPDMKWAKHCDSFIFHMRPQLSIRPLLRAVVPFKCNTSQEKFYLLLSHAAGANIRSRIEKDTSSSPLHVNFSRYIGSDNLSHRFEIGQGKAVFVTQKKCDDQSLANCIVYVSM